MSIKVGNEFEIRHNGDCWVLNTRSDRWSKKGERSDHWTPTYYPSLPQVARKMLDLRLQNLAVQQEVGSILEFEDKMKEYAKQLENKLTEIVG